MGSVLTGSLIVNIKPICPGCQQVFSQDKSIYEAVENAFITIYIRKNPVETAKNLLNLAIDSNIGDLAALEVILGALVSKGDITASMVSLYRDKGTSVQNPTCFKITPNIILI